jgi:hypothetical protein
MVRRSFRVGLRLGLLIGIGFALVKTVQSRRSTAASPEPAPWKPIVAEPVEAPVDEVGEPIEEPAATPASGQVRAPERAPVAESESGLDVPLAPTPEPAEPAEPVKKAAKKATKAAKVSKETAAATPPPAWVEADGGVCPPTHPVKAKVKSKLFHLPGMFAYDRTNADRCYASEEAAEADGLHKAKR